MAPKSTSLDPNDFAVTDIVQDREDHASPDAHSRSDETPDMSCSSAQISEGDGVPPSPTLANLWSNEQTVLAELVAAIRDLRADWPDKGAPSSAAIPVQKPSE